MLAAAMRTPDHGKLNPWWFIVMTGDDRVRFGQVLKTAWAARDPQATAAKRDDEAGRPLRAPLVIAVISAPRESTVPVWEQILSAGAACQNLCLAANALGWGSNWLTEWYAYDTQVRAALGLAAHESVAGYIYIGTALKEPEERERPAFEKLVNKGYENAANRGAEYAKTGLGFNRTGLPDIPC